MIISDEVTPATSAPRRRRRGSASAGWILRRIAIGIGVLLAVSILVFLATQALPGDVARVILGRDATAEQVAVLRERLGLDQPLVVQYLNWLGGALRGDFGVSLATGEPVSQVLAGRLLNSMTLVVFGMLIAVPLSLVLGVVTAERRDRPIDKASLRVSMILNALPDFVLGTLLVVLLGTTVFKLFPPVAIIPAGHLPWWYPDRLVLPVLTIVIMATTYLYRLVRASMIDVLSSEYVQTATLKGLTRRTILFRHALPNAVGPMIQATSIIVAATLGGIVVVEFVYNYPGLGTLLTQSIGTRDLPVVQAIVLVIAATYFICNLIADIIAGVTNRSSR